jgi:pyruvate dehydrogenase kinase 2/3/4
MKRFMLRSVASVAAASLRGPATACTSSTALAATAVRWAGTSDAQRVQKLEKRCVALAARCSALENAARLANLVSFYGSMTLSQIDIDQVIEKCTDPGYKPMIFCHRELPITVAHLIGMIDDLPNGLSAMPHVTRVRGVLTGSFSALVDTPIPTTPAHEAAFMAVLAAVDAAQTEVVQMMALGVLELRKALYKHRDALGGMSPNRSPLHENKAFQGALDGFYLLFLQYNFISRQMAHLESAQEPGRIAVGNIDTEVDVFEVAEAAAAKATMICQQHYGDAPEITIKLVGGEDMVRVQHIEEKLEYILVELLKNALRATVDTHMTRNSSGFVTCTDMPDIKVVIYNNASQHVTVAVEDEGGGLTRLDKRNIMSYTFTTVAKPTLSVEHDGTGGERDAPAPEPTEPTQLAGYGYGLPMSRLHARTFGGDLRLQTVEGHGTTAFLWVKKKARYCGN